MRLQQYLQNLDLLLRLRKLECPLTHWNVEIPFTSSSPDGRLAPGFGQSARAGLPIWGLVGPLTLVLWPRSERGLRGVSALGSRTWRGPHSLFIPLPARCPHVLNCANGDRAAGTPGAVAYRQAASYLADGAACPEDVVPDADLTPFWISADPPFPGSSESQV